MPWASYSEWQRNAHPYRVTLTYQRRRLTIDYWMGLSLTSEPTADDVIDSLLLDANAGDQTFDEFCSDMGLDSDSRKAEATWKACKRSAKGVRRLLGADYDTFQEAERS
jgi:hypothetical protein